MRTEQFKKIAGHAARKACKCAAGLAQKLNGLSNLFDRSRPGLAGLWGEFMNLAALRARCNFGVLFGHFLQEVRKRLATVVAQKINLLIAHIRSHAYWMPRPPERKPCH